MKPRDPLHVGRVYPALRADLIAEATRLRSDPLYDAACKVQDALAEGDYPAALRALAAVREEERALRLRIAALVMDVRR